ncbi:8072_t:CDS:2 [Diversispora eburnea]|uniref:8072_t:CDS:1 n=1 Tax=Diversispora eburnea TaxID=1213867 RepID=A0A9N8ZAA7_9GLOM|nr:8072_t:CDS:2 [Diversispora eburnea]
MSSEDLIEQTVRKSKINFRDLTEFTISQTIVTYADGTSSDNDDSRLGISKQEEDLLLETPVKDTPEDYVSLYQRCWDADLLEKLMEKLTDDTDEVGVDASGSDSSNQSGSLKHFAKPDVTIFFTSLKLLARGSRDGFYTNSLS